MQLVGVFEEVKQLRWIHRARDKLPGSTADHHEWSDGSLACIFSIDCVSTNRPIEAVKVWDKGVSINGEMLVQRSIDQIHECRKNVQRGDVMCNRLWREALWI